MTTSGTASIHTAIAAINPDPGDEIIDKAGMPIVDLTDDLKSHLHQPVYSYNQIYWDKEGHRAAARAIANELIRQGWLDLKTPAIHPGLPEPT